MAKPVRLVTKVDNLAEALRRKIHGCVYAPGEKMASVRELIKEYRVSKATVSSALSNLATEGLVVTEPGRGTFVALTTGAARVQHADRARVGLAVLDYFEHYPGGGEHPSLRGMLSGIPAGLEGIQHSLHVFTYEVGHFWSDGQNKLKEDILAGRVDALVVTGALEPHDVDALNEEGIPFVLLNWAPPEGREVVWVDADLAQGCRLLLSHLRELGHSRIGLITYGLATTSQKFAESFDRIGAELGLSTGPENIVLVDTDPKIHHDIYREVSTFFDLDPLPTAVILWDEVVTDRFIWDCTHRGHRPAQDIAFACVMDMRPKSHLIPTTGLNFSRVLRQLARQAGEILARMIDGAYIPPQAFLVKPKLLIRESTVSSAGRELDLKITAPKRSEPRT